MKKIFLLILLFTSHTHAGPIRDLIKDRLLKKLQTEPTPTVSVIENGKMTKPGTFTLSLESNGLERYFKIHIPKSYNPTVATTILFSFHGGGGNMEIQSTEEYYHQISNSELRGHVVVFPNGTNQFKSGKLSTWNAGECCSYARDNKIDDVTFIKQVIARVKELINVDGKRIFATGMSNGGMMSYRLACEMPEVFRGIAAVAGTDNTILCNPKAPISILHIHAKDDDHVLFEGGAGKKSFKGESRVPEYTSVPKTIKKWVELNGCHKIPKNTFMKIGVYCESYSQCKNDVKVELCVTDKGGHSWPGGKNPRFMAGTPFQEISANERMWHFFDSLELPH
ncbi:MAG: alpha/beta hydrolase family esterase [Bacteriovoracaceae bacterium]